MRADEQGAESARPTVVIIDDIPSNIQLLDACLSDEYSVRFATNGAAGLRIVRDKHPDIVLLDVMMPEMDGYEVCTALKSDAETKNIPIIFVSALDEGVDEAKGLSFGAVDYITKPFVPAIVQARVRIHIELKRLRDRLEHLSTTDGLTGLANRRCFDETLQREWSRALRSGRPLALVMMDIDFFKDFNDCYGHPGGDDCLRKVARALADGGARNHSDLIARYGGEEFAALLLDTDPAGAQAVAERLRARIADLAIPHQRSQVAGHVTVSIGVAALVPNGRHPPTQLVERADEMLYRAKKEGRNRVVVMES